MSGKLYLNDIQLSNAYAEGSRGVPAANPHPVDSPAYDAYAAGAELDCAVFAGTAECGTDNTLLITGVIEGAPGSFVPSGAPDPADLAALNALGALGETDAWTAGNYVVLADDSSAYWDSSIWALLLVSGVVEGAPGSFTPAGANIPADLTALNVLGAIGETTAWTTDNYVTLADDSSAYWNGTTWIVGTAP